MEPGGKDVAVKSVETIAVGLGEVLWDVLPDGKKMGGAPANFAYHSTLLGNEGVVCSRVGSDDLGRELVERLERLGLDPKYIQVDPEHPTSTVQVKVNENGQPDFTITGDVAWDLLEWSDGWHELAERADVACFGSLAQRSEQSRRTILQFLRSMRKEALRIFDVNLRQSYFSAEVLGESMRLAEIVKLNDEELPRLVSLLGLESSNLEGEAQLLRREFGLNLVCVTKGARGSLLATEEETSEHPGFEVKVADSVGSGDAFTAALAHHYRRGSSLDKANRAANRMGSWVAGRNGATPRVDSHVLREVIDGL